MQFKVPKTAWITVQQEMAIWNGEIPTYRTLKVTDFLAARFNALNFHMHSYMHICIKDLSNVDMLYCDIFNLIPHMQKHSTCIKPINQV